MASPCCGAARHCGLSLQPQNQLMGELTICGTKRAFAAFAPMSAFIKVGIMPLWGFDSINETSTRAVHAKPKTNARQSKDYGNKCAKQKSWYRRQIPNEKKWPLFVVLKFKEPLRNL